MERRYPDVNVYAAVTQSDVADFLVSWTGGFSSPSLVAATSLN